MVKKEMNVRTMKIVAEMNSLMNGLTMEDIQLLCRGKKFRFPVYPESPAMNRNVDALELTIRAQNALHRESFGSIRELVNSIRSEEDLQRIRNIGKISIREIMFGLYLYQFSVLDPAGKKAYMKRVMEMNGIFPIKKEKQTAV